MNRHRRVRFMLGIMLAILGILGALWVSQVDHVNLKRLMVYSSVLSDPSEVSQALRSTSIVSIASGLLIWAGFSVVPYQSRKNKLSRTGESKMNIVYYGLISLLIVVGISFRFYASLMMDKASGSIFISGSVDPEMIGQALTGFSTFLLVGDVALAMGLILLVWHRTIAHQSGEIESASMS